jgi:hypothetical protein
MKRVNFLKSIGLKTTGRSRRNWYWNIYAVRLIIITPWILTVQKGNVTVGDATVSPFVPIAGFGC